MTIKITLANLYVTIKRLQKNPEGYVRTVELTKEASKVFGCTPLTIRTYLIKNPQYFDRRHGLIRLATPKNIEDQKADVQMYHEWLAKREQVLKECSAFLATIQPADPVVESFLMALSNAREQLKSYTDDKLVEVVLGLKREYGFTPQTVI